MVVDSSGVEVSRQLYRAFGAPRYTSGTDLTDYGYTGQRADDSIGLMYYNARWYDPALGRFTQADTVLQGAGDPLAWDRYGYVKNSPIRCTDPTGHFTQDELVNYLGFEDWDSLYNYFLENDLLETLNMLLRSDVTYGSVILAGNNGSAELEAMLVLYGDVNFDGGGYLLTLWDMNNGQIVDWKDLNEYSEVGVWSDDGDGLTQVYENFEGATNGFLPPTGRYWEDVKHPDGTTYQWLIRGPDLGWVIADLGIMAAGLIFDPLMTFVAIALGGAGFMKLGFDITSASGATTYPVIVNFHNSRYYGEQEFTNIVCWDLHGVRR